MSFTLLTGHMIGNKNDLSWDVNRVWRWSQVCSRLNKC